MCGSDGVELSSNGYEIHNDILDKPRKGSALTIDEVKSIRDGKNNIIKEFPSVAQSHGFNDIVDNYAGYADVFDVPNGKLYQLKGSLNGTSGRFEWITQDGYVTHRRFIDGGSINGVPNLP